MYSDDDLFIIDEFFSIQYVAECFKHLVVPKMLIEVVSKLRRVAADANADPVEVLDLISRLRDVMGPFLFWLLVRDDLWGEWCPANSAIFDVTGDEEPFSDPNLMLWAGKKGHVYLRQSGEKDFVFHVIPTGGSR